MATYPLIWKCWDDDEAVVYHTGSGDTHLLNDIAADLLRLLADRTLSADELASLYGRSAGVEPDQEFHGRVAALLAEFDDLGLIEPAP